MQVRIRKLSGGLFSVRVYPEGRQGHGETLTHGVPKEKLKEAIREGMTLAHAKQRRVQGP